MTKQNTKNNTNKQSGLMVLKGGKWVPVEDLHQKGRA